MRIAVLAHSFPRFPGDTHGPFVKALSEALARRGHQVWALVPFDVELRPDPASPLRIGSFRYVWPDGLHRLGYSRTLKGDVGMRLVAWLQSPLYFHFAQRALRRLVREEAIELIHAHWILPNGYVGARVGATTGVPLAVTLHGSDVFLAERNGLFRSLARRALRAACYVTSCSADLRDRLLQVGGAEGADRVVLVPNGTELVPRGAAPAGSSGKLVVAVGRMVEKKGFRYLLEAVPGVLRSHPGARFVIGGGGELLDELRAAARGLGVQERVSLPGGLSHHEVLELVARADVFVMPSIRDRRGNIDGLPIVVLEAMAAGKPVVATEVSGMPLAVRDGVTGILVKERDPEALGAALLRLLDAPEEARSMGEAGRERIEKDLNWDAIARRHEELQRRWLDRRRDASR